MTTSNQMSGNNEHFIPQWYGHFGAGQVGLIPAKSLLSFNIDLQYKFDS